MFETYRGGNDISNKLSSSNNAFPNKNLLRTVTLGLRSLHTRLIDSQQLLIKNLNSNILVNRYKIEDKLAQGTFSTVYVCEDLYRFDVRKRKVALKAVNFGCEILAWREKLILDHLNHKLQRPLCEYHDYLLWVKTVLNFLF